MNGFTKYFLNAGQFKFSSKCDFKELGFSDGADLLRYATNEEQAEDEGGVIAVFDSLEEAKQELSGMRCRVDSVACGIGYEHDCEIPFIDQVTCDSDIKEYSAECDYDIVRTVAVAELSDNLKPSREEEIAEELRYSRRWDMDLLAELCEIAGMSEEFKAALEEDDDEADEYAYETVAYKAAEKLGVEIAG